MEEQPKTVKNKEDTLQEKLIVSTSPHILINESVPSIMHSVILALMPAVVMGVYFFGWWRALPLLVSTVIACMATEYVCQKMRQVPVTIKDGSAIITGILLALTLPPGFPLWAAFIGGIIAISLGKQAFGGLGYNIFNPALVGRAFLQAAFPVLITTFDEPITKGIVQLEAVSAATPLGLAKFDGEFAPFLDLLFGNTAGSLGETSAVAILIGAIYLWHKGHINLRLPMSYLTGIFLFSGIFWLLDPSRYASPVFQVLAGGAMLGAFFMVTDMVTSPVTPKGQWIFGIGGGILAVLIRLFGGLNEGVMYSILLMNAIVPLLNRYTRPKIFGEVGRE
ncbi:MAG: RnfABCDGE type electron transport complex subunit D [Thermodesulfobacteriota bacterium]